MSKDRNRARAPVRSTYLAVCLVLSTSLTACSTAENTEPDTPRTIDTSGGSAGENIGGTGEIGGAPSAPGGDDFGGSTNNSGGTDNASMGGRTSSGGKAGAIGGAFESSNGGSSDSGGGSQSGVGGSNQLVGVDIKKSGESLIALSGLRVVSYGGYLNGESFQQDTLLSHLGYQYSAFWNTNRNVVLTRRKLPDGEWEKFDFTDYKNTEDDAHNTISLGISPADGTLHLAFDHHGSDLHYRQSLPGLVSTPDAMAWQATSFTDVTSVLVDTTRVTLVTYPRFVTEPGGEKLLLSARIGQSGSGDEFLWEYNSSDGTWLSLGRFIDGVTDSVNAYIHGLSYGRSGTRLHTTWCWRSTPDPQTNHDLFYAYSDDHGRTWLNNDGEPIAVAGSTFITRSSKGAKVFEIGENRGLINQEHMAVDSAGRVHVLLSHLPDDQNDDSNFTNSRNRSEFFHYLRDESGKWTRQDLKLPSIDNFRGSLAISSSDNVYAILPNLRIAGASASSGYHDWTLLDSTDSRSYFSDPLVDTHRLLTEDELTIYYPETSSSNIWALDYSIK